MASPDCGVVGEQAVGQCGEPEFELCLTDSVETVDRRIRAVLEQAAIARQHEGDAVVPGLLRDLPNVAAGLAGGRYHWNDRALSAHAAAVREALTLPPSAKLF